MWLACLLAQSLAGRITPLAASMLTIQFLARPLHIPKRQLLVYNTRFSEIPGRTPIHCRLFADPVEKSFTSSCLLQTDQPCLELFSAWLSFSSSPAINTRNLERHTGAGTSWIPIWKMLAERPSRRGYRLLRNPRPYLPWMDGLRA